MVKKNLSKSEIKELNERLICFGISFDKKEPLVYIKADEIEGYIVKNLLAIIIKDGHIFPSLRFILSDPSIKVPSVYIDVPAVKFIANGADVMRPGIRAFDDFPDDSIVVVRDEVNKKPIALAHSAKNSQDLKIMEKGKVLQNLSYVGDKFWNYSV